MKSYKMSATVFFNGGLLYAGSPPSTKLCIGKALYTSDFVGLEDATPNVEIFEVVIIKKGKMQPLVSAKDEYTFEVSIPFYATETKEMRVS